MARTQIKVEFEGKAQGQKGAPDHCMKARRLIVEEGKGPQQAVEFTGYGADPVAAFLALFDSILSVGGPSSLFAIEAMLLAAEQLPLSHFQNAVRRSAPGSPHRELYERALNGTLQDAKQAAENLSRSA